MRITGNIQTKSLIDTDDVIIKSIGGLTGVFTKFGNKIFHWAVDNGIDIDLITKYSDSDEEHFNVDMSAWRIEDKEHRLFSN